MRVVCRFRPTNDIEEEQHGEECINIVNEQSVNLHVEENEHSFTFHQIFGQLATQQEVYEASGQPLVEGNSHLIPI